MATPKRKATPGGVAKSGIAAGGSALKIKLDTDALKLPGPGAAAGWGTPLPRHAAAREGRLGAVHELRNAGLSLRQVKALLRTLEHEHSTRAITTKWPTVGEDRKVLQAVADLAECLAIVLRGASPNAQAQIETAAHVVLRDWSYPRRARAELAVFARGLRARLDKMPAQSRNRSPVGIVRALLLVAGQTLPEPTTEQSSRFYTACRAAFTLAGVTTSPDRAIRALDGRSRKIDT